MDRCSTSSGVVVAVDFGPWHGPIVRGCGSTPTSGYQLVNQGGFATTGTAHDGPGFICRIGYSGFNGGIAEPADQKCIYTPPANASWTYWTANPNQHAWTASPTGAANTYPVAGAVQAWTFGNGSYPSFSPDSVRAQNSAPASASPTSKSAGSTAPASSPAAGSIRTGGYHPSLGSASRIAGRSASHAATSTARPPLPVSSAPVTRVSLAAVPSSSPNIVDAQSNSPVHSKNSGSALPMLAAGAIVLALAGLAGFTAWHRRGG